MAVQLDFSNAEEQRLKITQEQQEHIRGLYKQASVEVGKLAEKAPRVPSDALRKQYLTTLQEQIGDQLDSIEKELSGIIKSSMTATIKATVADAKSFLVDNGLPIKGAYSHISADIVRSVASGQLYAGDWTLSKALWLNTKGTQQDVQSIVAQGIIQNKSAYDIAKDLEKYVNPDAHKDWEWSKVYPHTKKVVDYNAQRLARTMVSHAYQQAFVRTTQKNPFVSKYKWEASNSGRVCPVCAERDGKLYDKEDLPLDHPNGMCTFTAVMKEDMDNIANRLADWAQGTEDPALDGWAKDLYGKDWEQQIKSDTGTTPLKVPPTSSWLTIGKQQTREYMQQFESSLEDLTEKQLKDIRWYSGGPYDDINRYLRLVASGIDSSSAMARAGLEEAEILRIQRLQATMDSLTLKKPLVLKRGTDLGDLAGFMPGDFVTNKQALRLKSADELNQMFSGALGEYSAFTSTSRNTQGGFYGDTEIILYAPAGTRGAAIESISRNPDETEVLLASKTRVRILSVEDATDSVASKRIYMEVLVDG